MKKCMGGEMLEEETEAPSARTAKSGKANGNDSPEKSDSNMMDSDAVREGTKALKGLFGF